MKTAPSPKLFANRSRRAVDRTRPRVGSADCRPGMTAATNFWGEVPYSYTQSFFFCDDSPPLASWRSFHPPPLPPFISFGSWWSLAVADRYLGSAVILDLSSPSYLLPPPPPPSLIISEPPSPGPPPGRPAECEVNLFFRLLSCLSYFNHVFIICRCCQWLAISTLQKVFCRKRDTACEKG